MSGPSARDDVLHRIRTALADQATGPLTVPRSYQSAEPAAPLAPGSAVASLLAERIEDYRATVRRCEPSQVASHVAAALAERGARRVVVPNDFYRPWLYDVPDTIEQVEDDPPLTAELLDGVDGVLTSCAVAIAETGTVVLDGGPGQGRRALTLVPDYHLVVVAADRIVPSVPAAIAALDPTRPLTWISGPSATSDIELHRVEGVHGPRTLEVIIAGW